MAATYRILCGALGLGMLLGGLAFFASFFQFQMPNSPGLGEPLPVGVNGIYFVAFTGCCLVAWGGCLLGAARDARAAPWIGTWTAVALVLNAVYRLMVWLVGDYHALGNLPRAEAAVFLLLALALLWTRPAKSAV
ncbi:MAG: hypothetical protein CL910_17110 [Deltaproteobacteria bacterium]|nr:hypothetical protein [Deltaproteobacteria bacterium]